VVAALDRPEERARCGSRGGLRGCAGAVRATRRAGPHERRATRSTRARARYLAAVHTPRKRLLMSENSKGVASDLLRGGGVCSVHTAQLVSTVFMLLGMICVPLRSPRTATSRHRRWQRAKESFPRGLRIRWRGVTPTSSNDEFRMAPCVASCWLRESYFKRRRLERFLVITTASRAQPPYSRDRPQESQGPTKKTISANTARVGRHSRGSSPPAEVGFASRSRHWSSTSSPLTYEPARQRVVYLFDP